MTEGRIRVVALGILVRPQDHAVLAVCFPGHDGQGVFYRPPGGGVVGERLVLLGSGGHGAIITGSALPGRTR